MDAKTTTNLWKARSLFSYYCVFDGFDLTINLFFASLWRENK